MPIHPRIKTDTSISVKNISFAYSGSDYIFNNISFNGRSGQIISILGPNGSGKTTLLDCLANLNQLRIGEIYINENPMSKMPSREIAQMIGYIPQIIIPSFAFTVIEYVVTGCAPYMNIFEKPSDKHYKIAYDAIRQLGIEHLADRSYMHISGGERQKVAIARVLAQRPAFILMDEPTAHLDYGNQIKVLQIVRKMAAEGYGILLTTHNPDHALLLGGQAAILDHQGTLRFGPCEQIIQQDILTKLYGTELRLIYVESISRTVCTMPKL